MDAMESQVTRPTLRLATVGADDRLRIWDPRSGRQLHTIKGFGAFANACLFSPDGARVLTIAGGPGGTVSLRQVDTGEPLITFKPRVGYPFRGSFAPDGAPLVLVSNAGSIEVWDAAAGRMLRSVAHPDEHHRVTAAISPDGEWLASGNSTIHLWSIASGELVRAWPSSPSASAQRPSFAVEVIAFAPDARMVASGGLDGLRVWDCADGRQLLGPVLEEREGSRVFRHQTVEDYVSLESTRQCVFSPAGRLLAAASNQGSVCVWDLSIGEIIQTFTSDYDRQFDLAKNHAFNGCAFSPDGTLLAAANPDGKVYVWDLVSGQHSSMAHSATMTKIQPVADCSFGVG